MKKLAFLILLLFPLFLKAQSAYEIMARYFAEDYYTGLHRIAEMSSYGELAYLEQVIRLELQLYDLFGKDVVYDFRIPNDIDKILGYPTKSEYTDIPLSNYIGRFREYATQNKFNFTYEVLSCEQMEMPSLHGMDETRFVKVVVNKYFRQNRKTTKVKETMVVRVSNNNVFISSIKNSYNSNPFE